MKVKVTVAHDNAHDNADGDNYHKKVGAVYEVQTEQDAKALVEMGVASIVKEAKADEPKAP